MIARLAGRTGGVLTHGLTSTDAARNRSKLIRVLHVQGWEDYTAVRRVKATHGRVTVVLRHPKITKVLSRGGTFRIEMTPGASRTEWGVTTVRTITVRR